LTQSVATPGVQRWKQWKTGISVFVCIHACMHTNVTLKMVSLADTRWHMFHKPPLTRNIAKLWLFKVFV